MIEEAKFVDDLKYYSALEATSNRDKFVIRHYPSHGDNHHLILGQHFLHSNRMLKFLQLWHVLWLGKVLCRFCAGMHPRNFDRFGTFDCMLFPFFYHYFYAKREFGCSGDLREVSVTQVTRSGLLLRCFDLISF